MRSKELLLIADVICHFVHLFQGSFAFQLKQKFLDFSHQSGVVDLKIVNRLVVLRQALLVVLAQHVLGFLGLVQLPQRKHMFSVLFLDFPDSVVEFVELLLTALFQLVKRMFLHFLTDDLIVPPDYLVLPPDCVIVPLDFHPHLVDEVFIVLYFIGNLNLLLPELLKCRNFLDQLVEFGEFIQIQFVLNLVIQNAKIRPQLQYLGVRLPLERLQLLGLFVGAQDFGHGFVLHFDEVGLGKRQLVFNFLHHDLQVAFVFARVVLHFLQHVTALVLNRHLLSFNLVLDCRQLYPDQVFDRVV